MEELKNKDFYLTLTVNFEKVVMAMLFLILVFQVCMFPYLFTIAGNVQTIQTQMTTLKGSSTGCPLNNTIVIPKNDTITPPPIKIDLTNAHKLGSGKLSFVVFSDYQCPFCERGYQTEKQIRSKYGSDITIYFKNFPLNSMHPFAQKAAEAAECASEQGKFWEYHDYLFEHQGELSIANLTSYADIIGLERPKFDICLTSGDKTKKVANDQQEGIALGVQGTPTYYIGDTQIVGAQPFSTFEKEILNRK